MNILWNLTQRHTKNKTYRNIERSFKYFWITCLLWGFFIRRTWLAPLNSAVILVIKILISGVILSFSCAMNLCIFFHWVLFILLLKPCPWLSNKIYVFTLKDFSSFSYMIFHSYLLCFPENIFTLSPLAHHIFHKYK